MNQSRGETTPLIHISNVNISNGNTGMTPTTKELTNNNNNTPQNKPSSSLLSCFANLCNTVLGAGMLGLPNGFAGSGYLGGIIFLFISSFFSAMGLKLLAMSAEKTSSSSRSNNNNEPSSFYTVANATLPNYGTILIDFAVAIKCFGVATGYLITIGDCMVDIFQYVLSTEDSTLTIHQEHILLSRNVWIIVGLITIVPISFFKTLNALRCVSTFSIIIVYALVLVVVLYAQGVLDPCEGSYYNDNYNINNNMDNGNNDQCKGETYLITSIPHMIKNLSIFVFSFTCHQNIFTVVNEISNCTTKRIDTVITLTICTALILYLIISIEGYKTYGNYVKGDILLNYPQTNLIVTFMRFGIVIIMIASYPLQLDPSRRCIISLIYSIRNTFFASNNNNQEELQQKYSNNGYDKDSYQFLETSNKNDHNDEQIIENTSDNNVDDDQVELPSLHEKYHQKNNICSYHGQIHNISKKDKENNILVQQHDILFLIITIIFLLSSLSIALIITDLGVILSIVGATGSTIVSYILPGLIYLKLCESDGKNSWTLLRLMSLLQLCLGLIILPSTLYFVITATTATTH